MAIELAAWLVVLALAAPGDIYRCADSTGKLSYQDHPCAGTGSSTRLAGGDSDTAASQRALQQWLDQQRGVALPAAPANPAPAASRRVWLPGPVSEAQLAVCSERFLHCAQGNAAAMDRCVSQLPRCADGQADACCPSVCISRYQSLRQQGQELASAVRLALLDPSAPACSAPPPG